MIVWSVTLHPLEFSHILGIYKTKESAERAVKALNKKEPWEQWDINSTIEDWEVI